MTESNPENTKQIGPPQAPGWPVRVLLTPVLLLLLAWLGLMSLGWNLLAAGLYRLLPEATGRSVGQAGVSWVYRTFWTSARLVGMLRIDSAVLDTLRDEPGGVIIAANHPSLLDALIVIARVQRTVCIMKASLMDNVFLGAGSRLARYIANDSPRQMIRAAVERLKAGDHLVLFPEGTRSPSPTEVHPFRPGITLIAQRAGVPIQTVLIETDSPYLGKGWPLWKLPPLPVVFRARLGRRFEPQADHEALLATLEGYFRQELSKEPGP
jgi:1-acyl-sn-glycerol-3-phosphate acyltransferase